MLSVTRHLIKMTAKVILFVKAMPLKKRRNNDMQVDVVVISNLLPET